MDVLNLLHHLRPPPSSTYSLSLMFSKFHPVKYFTVKYLFAVIAHLWWNFIHSTPYTEHSYTRMLQCICTWRTGLICQWRPTKLSVVAGLACLNSSAICWVEYFWTSAISLNMSLLHKWNLIKLRIHTWNNHHKKGILTEKPEDTWWSTKATPLTWNG
jgi:hypothetical protein